jgi:pimeloyl-ACP methyl ester carboxylesterase
MNAAEYRRVFDLVLDDDGVLERLEHLRAGARGTGEAQPIDVIARIVDRIPADQMGDAKTLLSLTKQVLDAMSAGGAAGGRARLDDEESMSRFLVAASQKLFARETEATLRSADAPKASERNGGRARDDEITDDPAAFRAELEALPDEPLDAVAIEGAPEQLGVYLHYLVHLDSDEQARGLRARLRAFLGTREPALLDVLEEYLELLRPGTTGPVRHEAARRLQAVIPGARRVELVGAGHLAALDEPAGYAREVLAFCGSLPP